MNYFISNLLIALGVAATPAPETRWMPYAMTDDTYMEIDMASLHLRHYAGGWEVFSRMKLTPSQEIPVVGKTKKGAYYIQSVTVICKDDKLVINEVTLHAKDGTVLQHTTRPLELRNPNVPDSFITEHIGIMCAGPESVTPQRGPVITT